MTKPKLRKNADINTPQSPHDGIHTCSKGCKKPGCNRTLRDTIEEQDKQIEALKRDLLEKTAELRNLKEVVHDLRISAEDDLDTIDTARKEIARLQAECKELKYERIHDLNQMGGQCEEVARLKAEVEELKALTSEMDSTINVSQAACREYKAEVERLTKAVMHSPAAQLKLKELEGKTTFDEINPDNQ